MKHLPIMITLLSVALVSPCSAGDCLEFKSLVSISTGVTPISALRDDVNRDKQQDLVTLTPSSVLVQLGNGDGTFAQPIVTPLSGATAFDKGDFNTDGNSDLAVIVQNSNTSPVVQILFGNGDGTFSFGASFPVSGSGIFVGNLNGDHKTDIAITGFGLSVYFGNGDGTFTAGPQHAVTLEVTSSSFGDFDNNGTTDFVLGGFSVSGGTTNGQVIVFLNDGFGNFTQTSSPVSVLTTTLTLGDYNGDGNLDIAYTNGSPLAHPNFSSVGILLGDGKGGFSNSGGGGIGSINTPVHIVSTDLVRRGKQDILVTDVSGNVVVLEGNGDGLFQAQASLPFNLPGNVLVLGDFDQDGRTDILSVGSGSVAVGLALKQCPVQATLTTSVAAMTSNSAAQFVASMTAGDLNFDGLSDVVVITPGLSAVGGTGNVFISVLLSDGSGGFFGSGVYPVLPGSSCEVATLAGSIQDANGDGIPDYVLTTNCGVSVYLGNGNGTFQTPNPPSNRSATLSNAASRSLSSGALTASQTPVVMFAAFPSYVALSIVRGDGAREAFNLGISDLPVKSAMSGHFLAGSKSQILVLEDYWVVVGGGGQLARFDTYYLQMLSGLF